MQMFWTNQQDRPAEDVQERPRKTDDAPWRLIFDYAVGNQAAHTIDRQITQIEILKLLAKKAQNEAYQHWQLVTEKVGPLDFEVWHHQTQPVIPRLFMAVTRSASLGPRLKCQIQAFNAAPVKE